MLNIFVLSILICTKVLYNKHKYLKVKESLSACICNTRSMVKGGAFGTRTLGEKMYLGAFYFIFSK